MLYKFPVLINIRGRSADHNEQLTCVITVSSVPKTVYKRVVFPVSFYCPKHIVFPNGSSSPTNNTFWLCIIHCIIFTASIRSLREGNVFSGVCLPVSLSVHREVPHVQCPGVIPLLCTGHWPQPCPPPLDISKHVQLGPHCTGTPRHIQTCSLWSIDCREAGGWHSTEMPSCVVW